MFQALVSEEIFLDALDEERDSPGFGKLMEVKSFMKNRIKQFSLSEA